MAEIHCPYCYGRNISKIVYAKKGTNKRKNQDYNLSDNEIIMPKNRLEKIDFDGELVTTHKLYNKYCNDCEIAFNTVENLATIDIKRINQILGNNTYRKRYIFDFYNDSPTYSFKHDYLAIKQGTLDSTDVINILKAIKDNNKSIVFLYSSNNLYSDDSFKFLLNSHNQHLRLNYIIFLTTGKQITNYTQLIYNKDLLPQIENFYIFVIIF